jgi:hypothetical protein
MLAKLNNLVKRYRYGRTRAGIKLRPNALGPSAGRQGENMLRFFMYVWLCRGDTTPVQKVSFVTKVGDQVCEVRYYK